MFYDDSDYERYTKIRRRIMRNNSLVFPLIISNQLEYYERIGVYFVFFFFVKYTYERKTFKIDSNGFTFEWWLSGR